MMMHLPEPFDIGRLAEQYDLEVKKAQGREGRGELPGEFFPTYCAMANTDGGCIVLGVEECAPGKFRVLGIRDIDRIRKALWDGLNNRQRVSVNLLTESAVEVRSLPQGKIIVIGVPRATRRQRPVFVGQNPLTGMYRRNFEGDYRCDEDTVRRTMAEQVEETRDGRVLEQFAFGDLDPAAFKVYRTNFKARQPDHPWNDLDDREFLRSIGGWNRDRSSGRNGLTLAGMLMFGRLRSILDAVPNYVVDYQEQPDPKMGSRWTDRLTTDGTWSGNLYDFYRLVMSRLTRDLKVPFRLSGTIRIDETPVHEALREALTNSLIHSDYSGTVPILIVKRPDLFSFRNPGSLRVPLREALQGGTSDCRNRNLQKMFQMVGFGEQAGSGIPKIFRDWRSQHWRPPELVERLDNLEQTVLTLRMISLLPEAVLLELDSRFAGRFRSLNEVQRLAVATAAIEDEVTNERLGQITAVHSHDLTKTLNYLVLNGFLESGGTGRGTFYFLPGAELRSGAMSGSAGDGEDPRDVTVESSMPASPRGLQHLSPDGDPNSQHLPPSLQHSAASLQHLTGQSHASRPTETMIAKLKDQVSDLKLGKKSPREKVRRTIQLLCRQHPLSAMELADLLDRDIASLRNHYLNRMAKDGDLVTLFPDRPSHPHQRYQAPERSPRTGEQMLTAAP